MLTTIDTRGLIGRVGYPAPAGFRNTKYFLFLMAFLLLLIPNLSCTDDTIPSISCPPHRQTMFLSKEDSSTTEAWLHVRVSATAARGAIKIVRDRQIIVANFNEGKTGSPTDTILYDYSLLPNRGYTYKAYKITDNKVIDSSNALLMRTMDTTSHDFHFEIDTLGDGLNSILRNVAIVNDTCAYAVGELHRRDTGGGWDPTYYNAARWNGRTWTYFSILYTYQGVKYFADLYSVFAFGENDFWVASNQPMHWNGTEWDEYDVLGDVFNGYINKMWGTSSLNMYMIGSTGAIAHFDGNKWSKMESGTDVDLQDIWGTPDGSTVWAFGYDDSKYTTILLRCSNNQWQVAFDGTQYRSKIRYDSLSGAFTSIYVPCYRRIFIASQYGIYSCSKQTRGEGTRLSFVPSLFPSFPYRLRGNNETDFLIAGTYNFIARYNGLCWKHYEELMNKTEDSVLLISNPI